MFGGEKFLEGKDADFFERRVLHGGDKGGEVGGFSGSPQVLQNGGEEAELAALQRVGVEAKETEQSGRGALHALGEEFGVAGDFRGRSGERAEDGEGDAGIAAGRVDGDLAFFAQGGDTLGGLAPLAEAVLPFLRLLGAKFPGGHAGAARVFLADPRGEVFAAHLRKSEE